MYHPGKVLLLGKVVRLLLVLVVFTKFAVLEDTQFEDHEFIELYNGESFPVNVGNWRIVSDSYSDRYANTFLVPFADS